MGAWGLGSDENDWTWDALGMGIQERAQGFGLADGAQRRFVDVVVDQSPMGTDVLNHTGVTILLLKKGCTIPREHLENCRRKLAAEKSEEIYPNDTEERRRIVREEIEIIDHAIANDGYVPGQVINSRAIAQSRSLAPRPWSIDNRQPILADDRTAKCEYCKQNDCKYIEVSDLERDYIMVREEIDEHPSMSFFPRKLWSRQCIQSSTVQSAVCQCKEECRGMSPPEANAALERCLKEAAPKWGGTGGGHVKSCANCGIVGSKQRCTGCRSKWYCNRKCQAAHWKKSHKYHCERLDKKQQKKGDDGA